MSGDLCSFFDLPPEIILKLCRSLPLSDVLNLQECHPYLDAVIDNVFFGYLRTLRLSIEPGGPVMSLSSLSSDLPHLLTGGDVIEKALPRCAAVNELVLTFSEEMRTFGMLECIAKAGVRPRRLTLHLRHSIEGSNKNWTHFHKGHRKLTAFVEELSPTLECLEVTTSDEESVIVDLVPQTTGCCPEVSYSHRSCTKMHQSLLYPIFNALNQGRPGPSSVALVIDCKDQHHDLALQSAFMIALPHRHRHSVRAMKLAFSQGARRVPQRVLERCLETFSTSLNDTPNLQELLLDLTESQLDPTQLQSTISVISEQLTSAHRIRVLSSHPSFLPKDEGILPNHELAPLPRVH